MGSSDKNVHSITNAHSTNSNSIYLFNRYEIISKLGLGSFGSVYKGIDKLSNKQVAIKIEGKKVGNHSQLKLEVKIYKLLKDAFISDRIRWPQIYHIGSDKSGNNIMVMDLLGPNLDVMLRKTPNKHFSPSAIAYMAVKMINLIEKFHLSGFVHRDLKPQNFVIESCEEYFPRYPEIYLIDYGLAKSYVEPDQTTHCPFTQNRRLNGTVRYSSINTHLGVEQSRRDDMQSLGYILVYLLLGKLPWQNLLTKDKKAGYHRIMTIKMSTPIEKLVENVQPPEMRTALTTYLLYSYSLMYNEEPHYDYCKRLFKNSATSFSGNMFK